MANLAFCLPGVVLVDPFCGVGTILQEAMLMKARIIGMDVNRWCVKASRTNLDWLGREYDLQKEEYTVLSGDSRNLKAYVDHESVDCVVTEPDLGPPLRQLPTETYARTVIDRLTPLYVALIDQAYDILKKGGRLVFVTPHIRTRNGAFVSMDIGKRVNAGGFGIVHPFQSSMFADQSLQSDDLTETTSFVDAERRHKIARAIHILQK